MGSANSRSYPPNRIQNLETTRKLDILREFSLSSFIDQLSGRSFATATSAQSTYSVSRPWSRVSRKAWKESTLANPLDCIKTAWPVPLIEALFLPEFKIALDRLKEYEVLHLISRGAFGQVFKVLKTDSEEVAALKILSKSKIINENCVNQVKDEVKIQSMCGHHPFVIDCPIYWQDKRKLYIATKYAVGGDLFELTEKYGKLPVDLCKLYIAEIACALDFLHNAGVIFRDLKPENVMLDEEGHVIIIDFGLSKWLKYGCKTRTICGTLQYMAPEVFSLEGYGHAVDWWSLGVLAHFLLTNKYPSAGNSSTPGKLQDDCGLDTPEKDLILRLLQNDPSKRLRSLLTMQTVSFFMGFNLSQVKTKQMSPRLLLEQHFPHGPKLELRDSNVIFMDFDESDPTLV